MALHPDFLRLPVAHRGLHDGGRTIPENSRAAVRKACGLGFGVEIDLQLSRDGWPMVFHDYTLDRLTDAAGAVGQISAAELTNISLRGGGEPIPALVDVLDDISGTVPILIELKDQHGQLGPTDSRLERAVARALTQYGGPVAVMSFNPHMVANLAREAPNVERGLVTSAFAEHDWPLVPASRREELARIDNIDRVGAAFITHDAGDLTSPVVAALKSKNLPVTCWTIRNPEQESVARAVADNITFENYLPEIPQG